MSKIATLMQQAAAGAAGEALAIEDVFSTYLYTGTGAAQTITNGIDLAGEGGLVWIKSRNNTYSHQLSDSERNSYSDTIYTNESGGSDTRTGYVTSVNSDGFVLGSGAFVNNSGVNFVSHTFRKTKNFFDIVTWTGNGTAGRTIPHNLGGTVGSIWVKALNDSAPWTIWHRSLSNTSTNHFYDFGTAIGEQTDTSVWNSTAPNSTEITLGTSYTVNASGKTYVAYIFAHHDGDGTFGEERNQDIIKCGVYQGLSSGDRIELGFEPQFLMIKRRDGGATYAFGMWDIMRGFVNSGSDALLLPGSNAAESTPFSIGHPDATGFVIDAGSSDWITSSGEYCYIAIRRGPMRQPTSGTEVFGVETVNQTYPNYVALAPNFAPDLAISKKLSGGANYVSSRLTGNSKFLQTDSSSAEGSSTDAFFYDIETGTWAQLIAAGSDVTSWLFRRAPGFFDVVAYTGDGTTTTATKTINHNLGVAPEMVIIKTRDNLPLNDSWWVHHDALVATPYNGTVYGYPYTGIILNSTGAFTAGIVLNSAPTDSTFEVRNQNTTNKSGSNYIAYLFATLPGVSKVGSYTGNGSSQTINCGFTGGARFVLIKRTDNTGDWYVWDTARGIVSGNDPHLSLNSTAAEVTTNDSIDPTSSGFIVNQVAATNVNVSSASYIFLAVS